jgi:hypothetical protein
MDPGFFLACLDWTCGLYPLTADEKREEKGAMDLSQVALAAQLLRKALSHPWVCA